MKNTELRVIGGQFDADACPRSAVLYLSEYRLIGRTELHIHVSVFGRYRSPEERRLKIVQHSRTSKYD